jgi:LysM repeat protein
MNKRPLAKASMRLLAVLFFTKSTALLAQSRGGMDEVSALRQAVAQVHLKMEALEFEVERLAQSLKDQEAKSKTEINQLRREIGKQVDHQKDEILRAIEPKLDKLAGGINPEKSTTFSNNYPKEGISYTVQSGDTLSKIAVANSARVDDIKNANKINDPSKLQVGQTLFIPIRN